MDTEEFKALIARVYTLIPWPNRIYIIDLIKNARLNSEYSAGDVKAAILDLKADGRIELDYDGYISR